MRETDPPLWWSDVGGESVYLAVRPKVPGWLLRIPGPEERAANFSHENTPGERYIWDRTMPHHWQIKLRHPVAIWDGTRILGVSLIERLTQSCMAKMIYPCPVHTHSTWKFASGEVRCRYGPKIIDRPPELHEWISRYEGEYGTCWTPVPDCIDKAALERIVTTDYHDQPPVPEIEWPIASISWPRLMDEFYERAGIFGWAREAA